jgi:putative NADH-flavin reductase
MRVLILGATGGTGKALIGQASERGHDITAFDEHLPGRSALASISRADPADFLLSELERGTHTHHIVGITGCRKGWA